LQLGQHGLCLAIVETRQHRAALDRRALAVAQLHDPLADQRRDLRPDARLDHARGVDHFGRIAARRRDHVDDGQAKGEPPDPDHQRRQQHDQQECVRYPQRS
jgi:hypothetical protein